jgi:hypothetical protein
MSAGELSDHLQGLSSGSRRRKAESETLKRALEEIVALYDWDRPNLQSPVKSNPRTGGRRPGMDAGPSKLSLGAGKNKVYVITKSWRKT